MSLRVPPRQSLGHFSRSGASDPAEPPGVLECVDSSSLDIGLLIAAGALIPPEGKVQKLHPIPPTRPTPQIRPVTLTTYQRLRIWWRSRFGWLIYR